MPPCHCSHRSLCLEWPPHRLVHLTNPTHFLQDVHTCPPQRGSVLPCVSCASSAISLDYGEWVYPLTDCLVVDEAGHTGDAGLMFAELIRGRTARPLDKNPIAPMTFDHLDSVMVNPAVSKTGVSFAHCKIGSCFSSAPFCLSNLGQVPRKQPPQ